MSFDSALFLTNKLPLMSGNLILFNIFNELLKCMHFSVHIKGSQSSVRLDMMAINAMCDD